MIPVLYMIYFYISLMGPGTKNMTAKSPRTPRPGFQVKLEVRFDAQARIKLSELEQQISSEASLGNRALVISL